MHLLVGESLIKIVYLHFMHHSVNVLLLKVFSLLCQLSDFAAATGF